MAKKISKSKSSMDWLDAPPQVDPYFMGTDMRAGSKTGSASKTSSTYVPRCYTTHPAYEVADGIFVYGGSCGSPVVKDADVYIGFDRGIWNEVQKYPWREAEAGPIRFLFRIQDMHAPDDAFEFRKMIDWVAEQLKAGKKVHMGCIGGHGRTGTVLAALRAVMADDKNATEHVRKNYCSKAVESTAQITFLKKEFGVNPVAGSKSYSSSSKTHDMKIKGFTEISPDDILKGAGSFKKTTIKTHNDDWAKDVVDTADPMYHNASIW